LASTSSSTVNSPVSSIADLPFIAMSVMFGSRSCDTFEFLRPQRLHQMAAGTCYVAEPEARRLHFVSRL